MKAVVFLPHDDDAIIGLGGSMIKLLERGWDITYVYMTDGRRGSRTLSPEETKKVRAEEAAKEREVLGIKHYHHFNVEDGTLSDIPGHKRHEILEKIKEFTSDADIVFIPSKSEAHVDHKATHDLVTEVYEGFIAKYIVWSYCDFYPKELDTGCNRIIFVPIDNEIQKKIEVFKLHKSQMGGRCDDMIEAANKYNAMAYKSRPKTFNYAEVFGLFNGDGKELVKALNALDITTVFHGRIEEEIPSY